MTGMDMIMKGGDLTICFRFEKAPKSLMEAMELAEKFVNAWNMVNREALK